MATSAIWNAKQRAWLTTFAPILISFSLSVFGDQSSIGSGVASGFRRKFLTRAVWATISGGRAGGITRLPTKICRSMLFINAVLYTARAAVARRRLRFPPRLAKRFFPPWSLLHGPTRGSPSPMMGDPLAGRAPGRNRLPRLSPDPLKTRRLRPHSSTSVRASWESRARRIIHASHSLYARRFRRRSKPRPPFRRGKLRRR